MRIVLLIVFGLLSNSVQASTSSLFTYDNIVVHNELAALTQLENYVETHQGVTLDQLKTENNQLLDNVRLVDSTYTGRPTDGPAGIPSFFWGCVLGWIGILVVYLITQDSEETKKALWGCLLQPVIVLVVWLIAVLALSSSYWY